MIAPQTGLDSDVLVSRSEAPHLGKHPGHLAQYVGVGEFGVWQCMFLDHSSKDCAYPVRNVETTPSFLFHLAHEFFVLEKHFDWKATHMGDEKHAFGTICEWNLQYEKFNFKIISIGLTFRHAQVTLPIWQHPALQEVVAHLLDHGLRIECHFVVLLLLLFAETRKARRQVMDGLASTGTRVGIEKDNKFSTRILLLLQQQQNDTG